VAKPSWRFIKSSSFALKELSILEILLRHSFAYPSPTTISYFWGFGSISGIFLVIQIITGVLLAMHYCPNVEFAYSSIQYILQDVNNGWLIRYAHANGSSFFFIATYLHMGRGLFFRSYARPRQRLWFSGVALFLCMMITAFLGYILPWGQMSLWGATVITNLLSTLPKIGEYLVTWLWGGFSVNNSTLNRFFSLHYLMPFLMVGLSLAHLSFLHTAGSSNPTGIDSRLEVIRFYPYFFWKDLVCSFAFCIAFFWCVYQAPEALGHTDNWIKANPLVTPVHIVPEWYFLPFYGILKAVPSKTWGVILMFASILTLIPLPYLDASSKVPTEFGRPYTTFCFYLFVVIVVILTLSGVLPVTEFYLNNSKLAALYYFSFFFLLIPSFSRLENMFWYECCLKMIRESIRH